MEEELKVKLTVDEVEPEEITFDNYCDHFKSEFAKLPPSENVFFNGWPTDKENFELADFLNKVGSPDYLFYLNNNIETQR